MSLWSRRRCRWTSCTAKRFGPNVPYIGTEVNGGKVRTSSCAYDSCKCSFRTNSSNSSLRAVGDWSSPSYELHVAASAVSCPRQLCLRGSYGCGLLTWRNGSSAERVLEEDIRRKFLTCRGECVLIGLLPSECRHQSMHIRPAAVIRLRSCNWRPTPNGC